jgi:hypothetical protein
MKLLLYSILLCVICISSVAAQTATQSPQAAPTSTPDSTSLREYREILQNERKLLEDQSEKYYARIDKLIDRTLWAMGIVVVIAIGLFFWWFGKTRNEMKAFVDEQFERQVALHVESDMSALRASLQSLITQVEELQAFQKQSVVWVFSGPVTSVESEQEGTGMSVDSMPELEALQAAGLHNIQIHTPTNASELNVGDPDLVIFSYDGTEEGRKRLEKIVTILKGKSPPVSLLIYTYNPNGPEIRLQDAERKILEGFLWYLPVNFPTTLVAQTQLLVRTKRKF